MIILGGIIQDGVDLVLLHHRTAEDVAGLLADKINNSERTKLIDENRTKHCQVGITLDSET